MKYTCLILLWSLFATMALPADNLIQSISIVPCPESITPGTGYFTFSGKTDFTVENEEQAEVARCFSALFTQAAGFTPCVKVGEKKGKISFLTDDALKSEAYHLEITPRQIIVKASDTKGFFYALQTIRQLLPASIEGTAVAETADWSVPAMTIKDEPRFGYRGLMVDVARFFIPKENLLRIIDCMGMLKINTLHLHLVDDNGWRIEIKRYPLLTEIGSRRVDRPGKSFPERRNPRQGESTVEKGFYTQEDIREIVAYAARHQVEVIPEIEMPAHSNAALASYPLLACPVVDKFIGVLPGLGGNHADVIFCAGNDSVFTFLQGVIDEVVELFPSRYIHLGGDEARKTHWKECPLCQERMRQEGLEDEEALQGYFMARMSKYVQSKGKEAMGWDELTNTQIPDGAIIYGWRGYGQAAVKAAEQGHRFVMTPARIMYLIRYQGPQWFEPLTYFGPLMVTGTQTIKCTTYRAGRQMGKTLTLPLVWNKATAKPVLGNTQAGKILVNGIRGSLRQSDFEWHSWESSDSVAFTIDLQKKESLRSVSVGCITNYGMAAHKPADIEVWVSNDNRDYRKVSGKQFTDGEIFREGTFKEDVVLDLNKEIGRYVRIIAKGAGECPATHVRPGQEARIYFDEVMIE